jgi:hypothetical protein
MSGALVAVLAADTRMSVMFDTIESTSGFVEALSIASWIVSCEFSF